MDRVAGVATDPVPAPARGVGPLDVRAGAARGVELDETGRGPSEDVAGGNGAGGGGIPPFPAAASVGAATRPPPALIPKLGRSVVLYGTGMLPRGASTMAMLRSDGGEAECVEVVGEGGARAKEGAGTARDDAAGAEEVDGGEAEAPERWAESGRGNCGGVSSYSSSSSGASSLEEEEKPPGIEAPFDSEGEGPEDPADQPGMEGRAERSCG